MKRHKKAFTLIELLVVILIIGVLAAVAVPQYQKAVEKSRAAKAITLLKTLAEQQRLCLMEHGRDEETLICGQGDGSGNDIFSLSNLEITGEPDPDCNDGYCGLSTQDFSFSVDEYEIHACRKPLSSHKYCLYTPLVPDEETTIFCDNRDVTDWCRMIGIV